MSVLLSKLTHPSDGGVSAFASLLTRQSLSTEDFNRAVAHAARDFLPQACHSMLRLDYLSCALTILSTLLIGRRLWQGWMVADANSVIICVIGVRTAQFGFVPANLFCIALYAYNLSSWRSHRT